MSNKEIIEEVAQYLFDAEKNVNSVEQISKKYPDLDISTGYEIQDRLIEKKIEAENTKISGYKLGLTSKAKQEMIGVSEPTYGVLLANMEIAQDEANSLEKLIHPKLEPEIAFIFNKEVKGPHVSVAQILDATQYVVPALEVIDSRWHNFKMNHFDGVADNSSSARYVLGDTYVKPDELNLSLIGLVYKQNGEIVDTAAGGAVMGHPARAVAWLANKLYQVGRTIQPGQVVLSGSLISSITIEDGDLFTASFDKLGTVQAKFVK